MGVPAHDLTHLISHLNDLITNIQVFAYILVVGTNKGTKKIAETLDVLRSLLSGHLSRQQEVNHLLTSAPLLVGEGQGNGGGALQSPRGGGQARKSPRQVPEGAEGKTLVRQGTFNVDEEGMEGEQEGPTTLHATLDAHLTRTKGVKQLK
ncbi:hypothetical protein E2C01_029207 [Portunus trituberculatus]|uniref:Uncharacterized protein n=1 Tax=Portunus trituberculatus TaxID=210409 RepID=A0A5B7ENI3_PORTR|nr:hypothetical protein [Portunus trituberculatus]